MFLNAMPFPSSEPFRFGSLGLPNGVGQGLLGEVGHPRHHPGPLRRREGG